MDEKQLTMLLEALDRSTTANRAAAANLERLAEAIIAQTAAIVTLVGTLVEPEPDEDDEGDDGHYLDGTPIHAD